jgi:hypothetical protein
MKLVSIYVVLKDKTFLVELIDNELTLSALTDVIQDRGIHDRQWTADDSKYTCRSSTIGVQRAAA